METASSTLSSGSASTPGSAAVSSAGAASSRSTSSSPSSAAASSGSLAGHPSRTFSLACSRSSAESGAHVRSPSCPSGSSIRFTPRSLDVVWEVLLALVVERPAERVPELLALRLEVLAVVGVRLDLDRLLRDGGETEPADAGDLPRVVREHADGREPEVGQDLRADPVLAGVRLEPELEVRLDRVETLLLELVGAQLVQQADPASLLRQIQEDAEPFRLDPGERPPELLAAVAAE